MNPIEDTVVSISSPPGPSLRGIVRISGSRAWEAMTSVLARPMDPVTIESHSSFPADVILLPEHSVLPVWVYWMAPPHSFTGEPLIEIHAPGNPALLRSLMDGLCERSEIRPAGPGEFTLRAFLHGRLSLFQAEEVLEVIQSRNEEELSALRARERSVWAARVRSVEEALLNLCAEVEAAIDFTDQDIEIIGRSAVRDRLKRIGSDLEDLLSSCRTREVSEGRYKILLYGAPNAGKSTLFNRLVPNARAIVSGIPGTTRDVIEGHGEVDSVPVAFLDSAGVMERAEGLAAMSMRRVDEVLRETDLAILVVDAFDPGPSLRLRDRLAGMETLIVMNKCDKASALPIAGESVNISAQRGDGLDELRRRIAERIRVRGARVAGAQVLVNRRQAHVLHQARLGVEQASRTAGEERSLEFIALDLREALRHLGSFTGRDVGDDILTRIFERFCIGK